MGASHILGVPRGKRHGRPGGAALLVAAVALVLLTTTDGVLPAANGLRTSAVDRPPMGWNSWNTFGCDINEAKILSAARALVDSGMRAAGYRYVVVDDCWQASTRAPDGSLVGDPVRFPDGMAALGTALHALGLGFGIYQSASAKTCAQYAGTLPGATGARGHEYRDARTFAAWGVDYLKYDWCSPEGTLADQVDRFAMMDRALRATGRPIVYSINPNSDHANTGPLYDWGQVADLWRTTDDITDAWRTSCAPDCGLGVTNILDVQAPLWTAAGPGHWNDPDMLEVGVRGTFSPTENRVHLAMWAMMAAPLIAGNDVTAMPADVRTVLTDPDVIALDQDPLGHQARRLRSAGPTEVWVRLLADGSAAVALLNRSDTETTVSISAQELPVPKVCTVFDMWAKTTTTGTGSLSARVPPHGAALYRARPCSSGTP